MAIPTQDFRDQVAVITGAGSGIGAGAAVHLATRGAHIALIGRTRSSLAEVESRLAGPPGHHLVAEADVSQESALSRAFDAIVAKWGKVNCLLANAGINGTWAPLGDLTAEEWDHTFAVNARGTFLTLRVAIPHLKASRGSVVVVSSVNGSRMFNNPGAGAYSASKAAQVSLAKTAALELAGSGVRVNTILPGSIHTDIESSTRRRNLEALAALPGFARRAIPLGGEPGSPAQVASLVAFLLSQEASHITGAEMFIDGAESLT